MCGKSRERLVSESRIGFVWQIYGNPKTKMSLARSVGGITLIKHNLIQKVKNCGSGGTSYSCSLQSGYWLMCVEFFCSPVCGSCCWKIV